MKQHKVGLWLYQNDGGNVITTEIVHQLIQKNITPIVVDLNKCFVKNSIVYTEKGEDISSIECLYYMNADEETSYVIDILHCLEQNGVYLINPLSAFLNARDKYLTTLILRKKGFTVPKSIFLNKNNLHLARNFIKEFGEVVKERISHGGHGVTKIASFSELSKFLSNSIHNLQSVYIEEYIEFGQNDIRIEVFDGKYIGAYSRKAKEGDFRTNITSGGVMCPLSPPQECIDIAIKAVEALGLTCSIVDMVISQRDNAIYILEVNSIMGIFVESAMKHSEKSKIKEPDKSYCYDSIKIKVLCDYIYSVVQKDGME